MDTHHNSYDPSNLPFPKKNLKPLVLTLWAIHRRVERFPRKSVGNEEVFDFEFPMVSRRVSTVSSHAMQLIKILTNQPS